MSIPKIRTITQCIEEIKGIDPESAISYYFVQSLCKENLVKHFMSGNKYLIDLDNLLFFLNNLNGEVAKCI